MTNDALEAARTGNWFLEHPLVICRLDKLSRDIVPDGQTPLDTNRGKLIAKLQQTNWDLIVCDEAHKLSASYFGNEVGFALTILQRRLASSPEAIYQSLRRRRERLEKRLREEQLLKRGADAKLEPAGLPVYTLDDLDDLDDAPDVEVEETEEKVVDQATAAQTVAELKTEIAMLADLERAALKLRQSSCDRKRDELSKLLQDNSEMFDWSGHRRKLVIFTEHRDTLNYLHERITALIGNSPHRADGGLPSLEPGGQRHARRRSLLSLARKTR